MRKTIVVLILLVAGCGELYSQPKRNGSVPSREKRGYDRRVVIDTSRVRVLYALNAGDIKDEDTYIDLGKLEIGKRVRKYSSEFLAVSDRKVIEWKKETGHQGNVPKNFYMGGPKKYIDRWSELVFSDYIICNNKLTEYACMPLWAEKDNGRYTEEWPLMKWTLSDETQTILGHSCQKAMCRFRGRDFVAWFASDVPVKGGPWKFGGLPGCILKVYDTGKLYVWEAVAIEQGNYPITRYPDKLYPEVSRQRIYKLQIRYNEDYRNAIGWVSLDGRTVPKAKFESLERE